MPDPYEIATWRFEQIAPFVDPSFDRARRKAAWRQRTGQAVEWPGAEQRRRRGKRSLRKPIPRSTLHRWINAYRRHGYLGLLPKQRADHGGARKQTTASWVHYAIGLLYEQPGRSLTQLEAYLRLQFADYSLSRSTLARHLRAHPAYAGIGKLRGDRPSRLRNRYEAAHPHECWQLDGKGPFEVRLVDGARIRVHVLSILDDHTRAILAALVARSESTAAAITVFEHAALKWGLADRFQFDRGSAFDSDAFRHGLAQLGVHRNAVTAKSPEYQGKIEAYHRSLGRWFVAELAVQQVVDLDHLQQLLEAMLELLYNRHPHREIGTTPQQRLAGRCSERRVSRLDLERAFFVERTATSHGKTGEVRLPVGSFRVPPAFAGQRSLFRHHPVHAGRAVLVARDGREIELQPFVTRPLESIAPRVCRRGTGQLQKLVDVRDGKRPNAQAGFGLPEVFGQVGLLVGRLVPHTEHEARAVRDFYRKWGPLPQKAFVAACERARAALGEGRPLSAYLADLERQIQSGQAADPSVQPDAESGEEDDR